MSDEHAPDDPLELRPLAAEGVELLEGIRQRGDASTYQEVQLLLLTDTPKAGPEDGDTDHPDQTPGPWPEEVERDR